MEACLDPGSTLEDRFQKCQDKCKTYITNYGALLGSSLNIRCENARAPVNSTKGCSTLDPPGFGGPTQYVADLSGTLSLDVFGNAGSSQATSVFDYTILPLNRVCPPSGCELLVTAWSVTAEDISSGGHTVSGMSMQTQYWATGTWQPNGRFTLPAGSVDFVSTFVFDGKLSGMDQTNGSDVTGTIDPVTGAVSIDALTQSVSGANIMVGPLSGTNVTSPPVAVINVPSFVECNQPGAASVTLDGTQSHDADDDIQSYQWTVNGGAVLLDAAPTQVLPLGSYQLGLQVVDATLALGTAEQSVQVRDTTPPSFPALPPVLSTLCDPMSQSVTLTPPVATDVCSPNPSVTGAVVAMNGAPLAAHIPVVNGSVQLAPGTYTVQWQSVDASGNIGTATQTVAVSGGIVANDSLSIDDRAKAVTASGGFAVLSNRGSNNLELHANAQAGSLFAGGNVLLDSWSTVHGSVTTAGTVLPQNNVTVTGTKTTLVPVPLPAARDLSGVVFPSTNSGPVHLEPSTARSIVPGAYGDVSVQRSATLSLTSGTYYFTSLDLEPSSTLSLDQSAGRVVLYVQSNIIERGNIATVAGEPGALVVGYAGTNTWVVEAPFPGGTVIAPNAQVVVGSLGANAFRGQLFAKAIEVRPDAVLTCQ